MHDVSFRIAPIDLYEAKSMIQDIKSHKILIGARGHKPIDIMQLSRAISRISYLGMDFPQIKEIDINPFIVNEAQQVSVDARIIV